MKKIDGGGELRNDNRDDDVEWHVGGEWRRKQSSRERAVVMNCKTPPHNVRGPRELLVILLFLTCI